MLFVRRFLHIHVNTIFIPDIIKNKGRHLPPLPTYILVLFVHLKKLLLLMLSI